MRIVFAGLPGFLLIGLTLLPGPAARPAEADPGAPRVQVETLDAAPLAGELLGIGTGGVKLSNPTGTGEKVVPLETIREVRFPERAVPRAQTARFRAHLVGGDVLIGALDGPAEDGVRMTVEGIGPVALDFEHILTLESHPKDAGPCHDLASPLPRADTGDVAYDARRDEFHGTVLEGTATELVLQSERGRKRTVAWSDLRVLHLQNDALEPVDGLAGEVELATGSRIALAAIPSLAGNGLVVASRTLPDVKWTLPFAAVRFLRWWGGRFVYASALPFEAHRDQFHADPPELLPPVYFDRFFGHAVDRRIDGCPLRVKGVTYRRGFGVYSFSRITIPLGGRFATFQTAFGIDDTVLDAPGAVRGDVDVRVLADGEELWKQEGVQGDQAPRISPKLAVSGKQTLELIVDFGKHMFTYDRGNWLDPILVRE